MNIIRYRPSEGYAWEMRPAPKGILQIKFSRSPGIFITYEADPTMFRSAAHFDRYASLLFQSEANVLNGFV
jgi:hypothetical protein